MNKKTRMQFVLYVGEAIEKWLDENDDRPIVGPLVPYCIGETAAQILEAIDDTSAWIEQITESE